MTPEISADDGLHFETGRHYCAIFNSDEEWRQYVHALLRHALAHHERFLYLYHSRSPQEIMSCLAEVEGAGPAVESGQAVLVPAAQAYYPDGKFDPKLVLAALATAITQASEAGYAGVCATGEASFCHENVLGLERFLEYEASVENSVTGEQFTGLCQYDRRHLPAELITEALLVHQYVICDGRLLPNHFYVAPDRYLAENRAENTLLARLDALREWNEAETALRRSEERYRTVADYAYDWECWYSPTDELLYISPSCERISGYTAAEFMADDGLLARIIHPEDRHVVLEHVEHCRNTGEGGEFESRIIRRDGEIRWVSHCCQPVYSDSGEPLGHRASNRDITGRKLERLERERLTAELEAVFDSLNECVLVLDKHGTCVRVNPAAVARYGFDPTGLSHEERTGRIRVFRTDGTEYVADQYQTSEALRGKSYSDDICRFINANGEEFHVVCLLYTSPSPRD